jgi:hypothetical protein
MVNFIDSDSGIPAKAAPVGTIETGLAKGEPSHLAVFHYKNRTYFSTLGECFNNSPFYCSGTLSLQAALAVFLEDYNGVTE